MALTDRYDEDMQAKISEMGKLSSEDQNLQNEDSGEKFDDNTFDGVIDLSVTRKKRFNVNRGTGNDGVLELNTSDMTIINRLTKLYPKLDKLAKEAAAKQIDESETDDEKVLVKISQTLTKIDIQMRQLIDEIFDSNVSEICAPNGSMFDPFNGEFRFEHIIDVISKLYSNNLNAEFKKMSIHMRKHTFKYTKGK